MLPGNPWPSQLETVALQNRTQMSCWWFMVARNANECMPAVDWSSGSRSGRIIVRLLVRFNGIRWVLVASSGNAGRWFTFFYI